MLNIKDITNTVIQGDCLEVMKSMPDNCVDLVMTSPPYNIKKKYAEYEDFLPWPEFTKWIYCVLKECARISPVSVFVIGTHNKMQFFTEIKQHLEVIIRLMVKNTANNFSWKVSFVQIMQVS
jgi:DNA modification methylase